MRVCVARRKHGECCPRCTRAYVYIYIYIHVRHVQYTSSRTACTACTVLHDCCSPQRYPVSTTHETRRATPDLAVAYDSQLPPSAPFATARNFAPQPAKRRQNKPATAGCMSCTHIPVILMHCHVQHCSYGMPCAALLIRHLLCAGSRQLGNTVEATVNG